MNLTLDLAGNPTPPSDMVRRLKQIDPLMGVRFVAYGGALGNTQNWWAITMDWSPTDPRQKMIQAGMMNPDYAFDIICQLPLDCPVDSAYGYVVQGFKSIANKDESLRLLNRATEYNASVIEKGKQEVMDLAIELVQANAPTLLAEQGKTVSKVYQTPRKKR